MGEGEGEGRHRRPGSKRGQVGAPDHRAPWPGPGACGTPAREVPQQRSAGKVATPPPPSAAAVTPTRLRCGHLFPSSGAGATCRPPGRLRPGPLLPPCTRLGPRPRRPLGSRAAWKVRADRAARPPDPSSKSQPALQRRGFPLCGGGMSPSGQGPSLSRASAAPKCPQLEGPRQGTEKRHRKDHFSVGRPPALPSQLRPAPALGRPLGTSGSRGLHRQRPPRTHGQGPSVSRPHEPAAQGLVCLRQGGPSWPPPFEGCGWHPGAPLVWVCGGGWGSLGSVSLLGVEAVWPLCGLRCLRAAQKVPLGERGLPLQLSGPSLTPLPSREQGF